MTWTNSIQGTETRFPEDCFPAVACYGNGVIVSCARAAAFVINERQLFYENLDRGGCATRLLLMSLLVTDRLEGNMWQGCDLQFGTVNL